MKIYNTMTGKKETFQPIEPNKVRMYVCGPTVYNDIHIGNARTFVVFDTIRRFLEYKGFDVNYVLNYTDVDDKIIAKAKEENVSPTEISERYMKEAETDMNHLNIKPATSNPKATEEIPDMLEMIQDLIDKDYAYEKNGTVYFRTRRFSSYGKLSKKNLDDLKAGIRIAVNEEKEDPLDFVLWKPKKEGEPFWPSPWGDGRPGWHIECSVMSKKYLGDQIDIHAGAEDLVFPHHENEIAQSEAANGKTFTKYWLHAAFLNIDNRKMSKSEGNFFTVKDIARQSPLSALRFFFLSAHYRSPLNFSHDLFEASSNGWNRIQTAVFNLKHLLTSTKEGNITPEEQRLLDELNGLHQRFDAAMEDDFNTADAISILFEIVKLANSSLDSGKSSAIVNRFYDKIIQLCGILGLKVDEAGELLDSDIEKLIQDREEARKNRDFTKADDIRDHLLDKGILLEDTREGVRWKKK